MKPLITAANVLIIIVAGCIICTDIGQHGWPSDHHAEYAHMDSVLEANSRALEKLDSQAHDQIVSMDSTLKNINQSK